MDPNPEIGIALRGITPALPIRLAGYAARKHEASKVDSPLVVEALVMKNATGERFAMNRRVYQGDNVVFGENPDGPVDFDVPVLRIKGTNGTVRVILFGYACQGTSIQNGDDWYMVSGDYTGVSPRVRLASITHARNNHVDLVFILARECRDHWPSCNASHRGTMPAMAEQGSSESSKGLRSECSGARSLLIPRS